MMPGCTDFAIHKLPVWADSSLAHTTYYKNCDWSGTYIVLNSDATFLYKHNGEGAANYLQKGNWEIKNDSILVLIPDDKLTIGFIVQMKQFEDKLYKPAPQPSWQYVRTPATLRHHRHTHY